MASKKQRQAEATKKAGGLIWAGHCWPCWLSLAGSIWYVTGNATENTASTGTLTADTSIPDEWGIGNPDAKLRIVEFGDYAVRCLRILSSHYQRSHGGV